MRRLVCAFVLGMLATGSAASAQTQTAGAAQSTSPSPSSDSADERRPATTTWFGDTGLWFVPTGEVLPHKTWSASGYRASTNWEQGFTNLSHFIGTFGVGVGDRAEVFGSWRFDTRIDRDVRPLFTPDPDSGGAVDEYPFVRDGWIGNRVGDFLIGGKFSLLSEHRQNPVAVALRGTLKIPTGDDAEGAGTGKPDVYLDAIVSKEVARLVEVAGFGGFVWRADPSAVDLTNGVRWGVGAGFPSRSPLRLFTELHGEFKLDDTLIGPSLTATDGSVSPPISNIKNPFDATIGLVYQHRSGFFVGGGFNWAIANSGREDFSSVFGDLTADYVDFQFRVGYHPGARKNPSEMAATAARGAGAAGEETAGAPGAGAGPGAAAAGAAGAGPGAAGAAQGNRPPTVKASCQPCTVEPGRSSTVTGDGQDPDGDVLTYRWSAPTGTFANPSSRQSLWTAPDQEGPVPVTVTVADGKGGTASDTVTIQVVRASAKTYVFEDVHFDFDRYTLRPEATRILDEVLTALRDNPTLRVQIEGHTCNIGTSEYNLALGDRRAQAVLAYLTSRGIGADRLRTVSYGEERPKYDNAREETRRLNRRAAMVVRLQ